VGSLNHEDLDFLNSKVVSSIYDPEWESATIIVKRNSLRHAINRCLLQNFASARRQRLYLFPAISTLGPNLLQTSHFLWINYSPWVTHADEGTKCPFPGLFMYLLGMPVIILANVCMSMGLVNGYWHRCWNCPGSFRYIYISYISPINYFNVHTTNFIHN
jgi:hypothetical protein